MLQVLVLMAWLLASDIERVYMHASVPLRVARCIAYIA